MNRYFPRAVLLNSSVLQARNRIFYRPIFVRNMGLFARFVENLKLQIEKNKEFQQNVKLLQDQADQLGESETLRKAKEAYAKAKEETIRGSEKLEGLKKSVEKIGSKVSDTIKDVGENPYVKETIKGTQETISNVSSKISSTTEPIRQTKMYANIRDTLKETVGDDISKYGGFIDKETRRKMKESVSKNKQTIERNPEAGSSMIIHKDSAWKESWNKFKETNPVMRGIFNLKRNYQDSDNILVSFTREITDRVSYTLESLFQENETAQAITQLKMIDPGFNIEEFMKELREFIIPEIMEAYLKGDMETLKLWCSEATYSILNHNMQSQIQQGLVSDSRVLDIRGVELATAKVLDTGIPVLVVLFKTQEVIVFRDGKTREIIYGREDQIDQATYLCVITKQEDNITDPVTTGWRILEMAKHGSQPLIW